MKDAWQIEIGKSLADTIQCIVIVMGVVFMFLGATVGGCYVNGYMKVRAVQEMNSDQELVEGKGYGIWSVEEAAK